MELADQKLIDSLLSGTPRHTVQHDTRASKRKVRCRCGECRECLDNARWERIFDEKFADPTYYVRNVVRHESPLNQA